MGDSPNINCSTDLGVTSVVWMRQDRSVVENSTSQMATLELDLVSTNMNGDLFTCLATSVCGEQEKTFRINVLSKLAYLY